eukprot:15463668-Alexandrium_andersonii.AAC.1
MAEGRWRWGTRGAISARASMARRVLAHDLQGSRPDSAFPPRWPEGWGWKWSWAASGMRDGARCTQWR